MAVEGRRSGFFDQAARDGDDFTLTSLADKGLLQFFDIPRRRQRPAIVVGALVRAVEPLAAGADEEREQQFLFVVAGEFPVDLVAQVGFQNFTVAVAQKSVLADGAREHAFVHAENEQSAEREAAGSGGAEHHDAVAVAPVFGHRGAFEPVLEGMAEIVEADVVMDLIETAELAQDFQNCIMSPTLPRFRPRLWTRCPDIFPARLSISC